MKGRSPTFFKSWFSCCSKAFSKHRRTVFSATLVRLFLIIHIIITIWRVSLAWDDKRFWIWLLSIFLIVLEGLFTIRRNKGIEWKWFCPLFAAYLAIVLPMIWFLEIAQMNKFLDNKQKEVNSYTSVSFLTTTPQRRSDTQTPENLVTREDNATIFNSTFLGMSTITDMTSTVTDFQTTTQKNDLLDNIDNLLRSIDADTWVVLVEESLVYLIVIGRWLLPRGGGVSREALSDLLIDYLAMASDIMELFAVFDQNEVRGNVSITYAVLAVWSLSFLQFIPVMANRRAIIADKRASFKKNNHKKVSNACGEYGLDIFVTLTALMLQDGPFLVLRLFIIVHLRILTYSLVFFVLKNIIVVMLLTYRLFILCTSMPCCYKTEITVEGVEYVDFDNPIDLPPKDISIITMSSEKSKGQLRNAEGNTNQKSPVQLQKQIGVLQVQEPNRKSVHC